jgi:chromosome segregation ATPase
MEDENVAIKSKYRAQISALREQVAHERKQRSIAELCTSEHEARIRQLEETVARNRTRTSDLTAQIDALDKEHQNALREKTQDQQQHAQETGTLNVRISELATSLAATRSEAHRLRQVNTGLEEQLQIELEARDELLDQWAAEQARSFAHMKETVSSERRRAKVRAANWELKSDDLMSDGTTIAGSEPITPVSMTRFVDVEMGRGKVRRRLDSGVGIITGDELLESEDASDNDLPTPNLIGL